MISGFDHVVIGVRDLGAAINAYETLLGRSGAVRDERDGVVRAVLRTGNIGLELMSPVGESDSAHRLRAAIEDGGEGLKSLVFAADGIESVQRRLDRVGLKPAPIEKSQGWRSFRIDTARSHGARLFVLEQDAALAPSPPIDDACVSGLDHIVIRTSDAERAAALYGARLGARNAARPRGGGAAADVLSLRRRDYGNRA